MKFSYSAVWEETVRLVRANGSLLTALSGVFLFLPALLVAYFLPQPQSTSQDRLLPDFLGYVAENWPWLLLSNIVNMIGVIAILLLLFGKGKVSVGGAIGGSLPFLPVYFLAAALSSIMIGAGLALLFIPGAYLFARLCTLGPAVVAERKRSPIDALRRAFEVSKGNGWAILGLLLIVFITGLLISYAITAVLGTIFLLVGGQRIGSLLVLIVGAATSAAVSTIMTVLFAAIYERLAGAKSAPEVTQ